MTEEIIINGVDVSGCVKQGETVAGITCGNGERIRLANEIITKHKLCKDNPNCYYKQLQREKQNSQESRDTSIKEFNRAEELNTLLKCKEQECEILKEKLVISSNSDQKTLKIIQTLAEIKDIAEVEIECKTYEIENDCFNETRCKALNEHIDFIKQILQKISDFEVKNE